MSICGVLSDLVAFVQLKKREKHPWRRVTFSKVAGSKSATLRKVTLLHGCFSRFLNCMNGTKSRKAPHVRFPTQADHNSRRSQYSHVFFTFLSSFICGKFEKIFLLVTHRNQVFLYFHFYLKNKSSKKYSIIQFICTIHIQMICRSMISGIM